MTCELRPTAVAMMLLLCPPLVFCGPTLQPLDPDPTFAGDGSIVIEIGVHDRAYKGFVEPSGEIVVFGESDNGNASNLEGIMQRIASDGTPTTLSRFDAAGFGCSVPRSFATAVRLSGGGYIGAGYVQESCGGIPRYFNALELTDSGVLVEEYDRLPFANQLAYIWAIGEQSDGRIVAAGFRSTSGFDNDTYDIALARFTMGGELDLTFGTSGTFTFDLASGLDWTDTMLIDSSDRILVVGYGTNAMGDRDVLVLRLTADGALDTTFGTGGVFQFDFAGFHDGATGIAQDLGGRLLVAANVRSAEDAREAMLLGLTETGMLDPGFSGDGMAPIILGGSNDAVSDITIGPGRLIYAVGPTYVGGTSAEFYDMAVTVVRPDGTPDARFNNGLPQVMPFDASLGLQADYPSSVALSQDGEQIVVTGYTDDTPNSTTQRFGVARFIGLDLVFEDGF